MPSPFFSSSCSCLWPEGWRQQRAGRPGGPPACPPGSAGPPGSGPPKGIWNENAFFAPAQKSEISLLSRNVAPIFCTIFKFYQLYGTWYKPEAMFAKKCENTFSRIFSRKRSFSFQAYPHRVPQPLHQKVFLKHFQIFPIECRTRNMLAKMRKYIFANILSKTIIFVSSLSSPCPATAPPLRPGPVADASPHSQMPKIKREKNSKLWIRCCHTSDRDPTFRKNTTINWNSISSDYKIVKRCTWSSVQRIFFPKMSG